jgi:hypothetical protein
MPISQTQSTKTCCSAAGKNLTPGHSGTVQGGRHIGTQRGQYRNDALGLAYVVLHGAAGVLAVNRALVEKLALRVMKRWPASLEKVTPPGSVGNDTGNEVI